MRNIKTGIAVALCVLVSEFIVENPMYAGIGCLVSIQDTVSGSIKSGLNRVKGTILGGFIGFLSIFLGQRNPIVCGLGTMLVIYGCTHFKMNTAIVVSTVTFLSINLDIITTSPIYYSFHRVLDTIIGVIIGIFVNYILARPDYFEIANDKIHNLRKLIEHSLEEKINNNKKFNMQNITKEIQSLETTYLKLIEEHKFKKNKLDIDYIKDTIEEFKEISHHMQSIELLDEEISLNEENISEIKKLYKNINTKVDNSKSPVFNYHLSKIIEDIEDLDELKND